MGPVEEEKGVIRCQRGPNVAFHHEGFVPHPDTVRCQCPVIIAHARTVAMSSAAASAQPTAAIAAVPPPPPPAPGAPLPPPQLLDVLCALYRSVHQEFALLVGLSSDFFHDAGLLSATATVVSTRRGGTRLCAAVERNDVPRATELLAACPTPAATATLLAVVDTLGQSVLMYATDPAMAQLLLRAGADPQAVDNDGRDALADAAERGKLGVFRVLAAALPGEARRLAATALLRRAVHMSNVSYRACNMNIHRIFEDGDGEGFDYVNWCGLGHVPAGLQEACIPFGQASTHQFLQGLEGIRELQLLSVGELAALVTPSDESTLREFYRGEFSYHASILSQGVLSILHRRRWPRSFQDSWIAACAIPLQAALFALDADAPIDTRVPARMGPLDEAEYDANDRSHDEPMREWLAAHSAWFGPPLVAAALARWT